MSLHLVGMYYGDFDGFTILKLPYRMGKDGNMFSMHIFLPDERDGLPKLVEKMGSDPAFLNQNFELSWQYFEYLYLPKFKLSCSFKPHPVLEQLGHEFELGGQRPTLVPKVSIAVNEMGTEGAAATLIMGIGAACPRR